MSVQGGFQIEWWWSKLWWWVSIITVPFWCPSMILLPYYLLADHIQSTVVILNTDIDECTEGTHQCQQNCHNTIGSYTCSCNNGFTIDTDGRSCNGRLKLVYTTCYWVYSKLIDIDECSNGAAACDQLCNNTVGSYYCNCSIGYRLLSDGSTCQSEYIPLRTMNHHSAYNISRYQRVYWRYW